MAPAVTVASDSARCAAPRPISCCRLLAPKLPPLDRPRVVGSSQPGDRRSAVGGVVVLVVNTVVGALSRGVRRRMSPLVLLRFEQAIPHPQPYRPLAHNHQVPLPQQIAERLSDNLQFLTSGDRTAVSRHQTIQTSIDWSYAMLSAEEQLLFRQLAAILDDARQLDFMVALGTHPPLSPEQLNDLVGITESERRTTYRQIGLLNHAGNNPAGLRWLPLAALVLLGGCSWFSWLPFVG